MALEINQPQAPKKTFVLNRTLHVTKDGRVVEEDDVEGVKVLGGKGRAFYEEEAKTLGLNESHREGYVAPVPSPESVAEAIPEPVIPVPELEPIPELEVEPKPKPAAKPKK